jgi:hypothetical protein
VTPNQRQFASATIHQEIDSAGTLPTRTGSGRLGVPEPQEQPFSLGWRTNYGTQLPNSRFMLPVRLVQTHHATEPDAPQPPFVKGNFTHRRGQLKGFE